MSGEEEMMQRHVEQLGEHFDTVQIFTTKHPGKADGTDYWSHGSGNVFARRGHAEKWLEDFEKENASIEEEF